MARSRSLRSPQRLPRPRRSRSRSLLLRRARRYGAVSFVSAGSLADLVTALRAATLIGAATRAKSASLCICSHARCQLYPPFSYYAPEYQTDTTPVAASKSIVERYTTSPSASLAPLTRSGDG